MTAREIRAQVKYWRDGAAEELACAEMLARGGHARQALFFAHLALEKALKAHVTQATGAVAPKTHSLTVLARLSGLSLDAQTMDVLGIFNQFCVTGRYPDESSGGMTRKEVELRITQAHEMLRCLTAAHTR